MATVSDELLEKLGYDSSDKASILFKDYVDYTRDELLANGRVATRELLADDNSSLYVELAYFITEIGISRFCRELNRFHKKRDLTKIDVDVYHDVYGDESFPTYQQSAYLIANYINGLEASKANKKLKLVNKN